MSPLKSELGFYLSMVSLESSENLGVEREAHREEMRVQSCCPVTSCPEDERAAVNNYLHELDVVLKARKPRPREAILGYRSGVTLLV